MIKSITINNAVTFEASGATEFGLSKVDGLSSAKYRTTSFTFAGRDGGMVPDQKRGQRLVQINADIDTNSPTDHAEAREALLGALSFNENVPVTVTTVDGRKLLFYAKFEEPQMPVTSMNATDVQLLAIADDWRLYIATSGSINAVTVLKQVNGGARWRASTDGAGWRWLSGSGLRWSGGAGAVNAYNAGSTSSNPLITITGANQNPVIRNNTTGQQIQVNVSTGASDIITIDTRLKATKLNGGNINALVAVGSTYFALRPGDNIVTLTNDNASGGQALIEWYDAVTGV